MPAGFKLGLAAALILLIAVSAYFFAGGGEQDPSDPSADGGGYFDPTAAINPADPSLTGGSGDQTLPPPPRRIDEASLNAREVIEFGTPDPQRQTADTSRELQVDEFDLGTPRPGQAASLQPRDPADDFDADQPDDQPTETLEDRIAKARNILQSSNQDTGKGDIPRSASSRPDFTDGPTRQPRIQHVSPTTGSALTRYTVRPGDNLWTIAEAHYGDGNLFREIEKANPGLRPDRLQIGTTINLPTIAQASTPVATADARTARRNAIPVNTRVVTVREGDSLYRIAERTYGSGVHWRLIYEANRDLLPAPDQLKVGQTLIIPGDTPQGK